MLWPRHLVLLREDLKYVSDDNNSDPDGRLSISFLFLHFFTLGNSGNRIDVLSFFVCFNRKKDFFLPENEYKWKASYITSNIMVPTDPTYGLFF